MAAPVIDTRYRRQIRMPTASTIDAVEKILRAAGLESYRAEQLRIHDDTELISS